MVNTISQKFFTLKTEDGYILVPILSNKQLQDDLIPKRDLMKSFDEAHQIDIELEK